MIKNPDPLLPSEVLFLLWAMGHGEEVGVVGPSYPAAAGLGTDGPRTVLRMDDVDVPQAVRAVLSALQLDTTFVADPVRQLRHGDREALHELRRAAQAEVDDALGFPCPITSVPESDFHTQVGNCLALIVAEDARGQGAFILRKGLDVTPAGLLPTLGRQVPLIAPTW